MELFRARHQGMAVRRRADHLAGLLDKFLQRFKKDEMIIRQQDSYWVHNDLVSEFIEPMCSLEMYLIENQRNTNISICFRCDLQGTQALAEVNQAAKGKSPHLSKVTVRKNRLK
jgi:hypothetical protein